jgi:hypothetical protein
MKEYNAAFFTLYENFFLILKENLGEEKTLELLGKVLERGLGRSYDSMGFQKGSPQDFARVIKARDEGVGLHVEFPEIGENRIIYRFHTDPFPNLKGQVDPGKLDATYMAFKVRYLLGEGWSYSTTKHLWRGDSFTEHVIARKA